MNVQNPRVCPLKERENADPARHIEAANGLL
jgi:hypothetical protein